ncbi:hypothetical protein RDI58_013063 [Solanum bulbocastanum]|uniref:TF-B3 domain-containing protein n=1 Tax=Solanum bulbocastanum TaxID=147425 RepID=A0AAN8YDM9_SOLBU
MEDIKVHPDSSRLDILAAVCERASEIHEKEAEIVKKVDENSLTTDTTIANQQIRNYDQEEENCIVGKKRKEEILPMSQIVNDRINELEKKVREVKFIMEKNIYYTDVSETHNRLSIPTTQIVEKFLTDEEEEYLCMCSTGNKKNFKKVRVIDPCLDIGELELRRWEMKKLDKHKEKSKMSVCYVLNGKWTKMRIRNKIEKGNRIQIWAVRMDDDELIIVLVKLK